MPTLPLSVPSYIDYGTGTYSLAAILIPLVVMLVFGVATKNIAVKKGRSPGVWFILGFLTTLIGLLIASAMSPTAEASERDALDAGGRRCPMCAEVIRVEAIRCKHCGSDVSSQPTPP